MAKHITLSPESLRDRDRLKDSTWSIPWHLTPWAIRPHRKLAQKSHQCGPLNVCSCKIHWTIQATDENWKRESTLQLITTTTVFRLFYTLQVKLSYPTSQVKNWRMLLMQIFTARMPLLTATSASRLGRIRWSSALSTLSPCLQLRIARN